MPEESKNQPENEEQYENMDTIKIRKIPFKPERSEDHKEDAEKAEQAPVAREVKPTDAKPKRPHLKLKSKLPSATPAAMPTAKSEESEKPEPEPQQADEPATPESPKENAEEETAPASQSPKVEPPAKRSGIKLKGPREKKTKPAAEEPQPSKAEEPSTPPPPPPLPGAAPPPKEAQEPAAAEPAPSTRPAKPRLQSRGTQLPEHLQAPPEAPKGKKGKKAPHAHPTPPGPHRARAEAPAGVAKKAAPIVALILVIAGNALSMMPAWTAWAKDQTVPTSQLISVGVGSIVMALLIIPRKTGLRIFAAVLTFLMVVFCAISIFLPWFIDSIVTDQADATKILASLPSVELLAASGAILMGAFILLTGGTVIQWVLAALFVAAGAALPWPPVAEMIPDVQRAADVVAYGGLSVPLPSEWKPVADASDAGVKYAVQGTDLELTISEGGSAAERSLAEYATMISQELKERYPDKGHYLDELPNVPNMQRASVFLGTSQVDVLIVQRDGKFYKAEISGPSGHFEAHKDLIDETVDAFK